MHKSHSRAWGANPWKQNLAHILVSMIREKKIHGCYAFMLGLDFRKERTLRQNAQSAPEERSLTGKTIVLFFLGKASVEIPSKKDRETCLSSTTRRGHSCNQELVLDLYHTPAFLHQNQKWLNFSFMSLPKPQTQWICLLSHHKLSLMESIKHTMLSLCY